MAITSTFNCRSPLGAVFVMAAAALVAACGGPSDVAPVSTLEPLVPADAFSTPVPVDLRTAQAQDLSRIRDEHAARIAAIPTATPPPTRSAASIAGGYLLDGEPLPDAAGLVPEPRLGVWWYRHSGGDWTTARFKSVNPYYPLFYAREIEPRYPTFENGGLQNEIGRLLADEIVQILPEIADRAPTLVAPLGARLGWEFADPDVPAVRVWSRFTYAGPDGLGPVEYRVGGLLAFTLGDHRDVQTGDVVYQYPVISNWVGPVLLEESPAP